MVEEWFEVTSWMTGVKNEMSLTTSTPVNLLVKLPSYGPRDPSNQWFGTMGDMVLLHSKPLCFYVVLQFTILRLIFHSSSCYLVLAGDALR